MAQRDGTPVVEGVALPSSTEARHFPPKKPPQIIGQWERRPSPPPHHQRESVAEREREREGERERESEGAATQDCCAAFAELRSS